MAVSVNNLYMIYIILYIIYSENCLKYIIYIEMNLNDNRLILKFTKLCV